MDFKVYVATRIRRARELRGWGQKEFAAILGVPVQTLNGWESGRVRIKWENLEAIARTTGHPLSFFIPGGDTPDLAGTILSLYPDMPAPQVQSLVNMARILYEEFKSSRGIGPSSEVPSAHTSGRTGN
jgi:transcriptional regulator with XRE-family HTH domain